ncbi:hypothetical protein C8R48DRAFT_734180 [Suillus tomentosus]|nr:hypothetical protein C8R48DRAFT_734180 [Suillus tomentosus]
MIGSQTSQPATKTSSTYSSPAVSPAPYMSTSDWPESFAYEDSTGSCCAYPTQLTRHSKFTVSAEMKEYTSEKTQRPELPVIKHHLRMSD